MQFKVLKESGFDVSIQLQFYISLFEKSIEAAIIRHCIIGEKQKKVESHLTAVDKPTYIFSY